GLDTNATFDVFVRDRVLGRTVRASVAADGSQLALGAFYVDMSEDGRYVAFSSSDPNVVGAGADTNGVDDIFVRDMILNTTARVSVTSMGAEADGDSIIPKISSNGRFVVFRSYATNLVPGDTNVCASHTMPGSCPDIFLHDRDADGNGVFDEFGPGKIST